MGRAIEKRSAGRLDATHFMTAQTLQAERAGVMHSTSMQQNLSFFQPPSTVA